MMIKDDCPILEGVKLLSLCRMVASCKKRILYLGFSTFENNKTRNKLEKEEQGSKKTPCFSQENVQAQGEANGTTLPVDSVNVRCLFKNGIGFTPP